MDLYIVLGLARDATLGDIKRAYRRLARRYHPDINPGDGRAAAQFAQIVRAYETLSDPSQRQAYDAGGAPAPSELPTVGFEGFDFSMSVSGAEAPTFGDLFSEVWAERAERTRGPERGADLHQVLRIPFALAARGGQRTVTITRQMVCPGCTGTGMAPGRRDCPACQGSGTVRSTRGHMVFTRPCAACRATGQQPDGRCRSAVGSRW
jgi:molecular chaperone DnaJ